MSCSVLHKTMAHMTYSIMSLKTRVEGKVMQCAGVIAPDEGDLITGNHWFRYHYRDLLGLMGSRSRPTDAIERRRVPVDIMNPARSMESLSLRSRGGGGVGAMMTPKEGPNGMFELSATMSACGRAARAPGAAADAGALGAQRRRWPS